MSEHLPPVLEDDFELTGEVLKMSILAPYGMYKKTAARMTDSGYFHNSSYTKDLIIGTSTTLKGRTLYVAVRIVDMDSAADPAAAVLELSDNVKIRKFSHQEMVIEKYDAITFRFLISLK